MASPLAKRLALILAATSGAFAALDVDLTNADSIKAAAKIVAANLLSYYHGDEPGQTPGILPGPPPGGLYFWWEAGAMWGTLVDYWHYTNDTTYNNMTTTSLVFQSEGYYQPANWTLSLGFDDQGFWAMSALLAAEVGYPDPPAGAIGWLALAQGVFNYQVSRWDTTFCNGGLPWQIPQLQRGYDYKNTIVTGIMFNMAARLAHYTGNDTYAQWAEKTWDWLIGVRYVDAQWNVYDGGHDGHNCTDINPPQFSYNAAVLTQGLAYLWAYTNTSTSSISSPSRWESSLNGLLNRTLDFFFPDGIMVEMPCEQPTTISCTTDELSFKGYMHRWLATTTQLAPWTRPPIMAKLRTSAAGMVKACNPDGTCGFRWNTGGYDGSTGAGQEMSALAALMSLLVTEEQVKAPLTSDTGGTSKSDPNAGINVHTPGQMAPITSGDRAGAAILTAVVLASFLGALWWLVLDETKPVMAMPKWWPGRNGG